MGISEIFREFSEQLKTAAETLDRAAEMTEAEEFENGFEITDEVVITEGTYDCEGRYYPGCVSEINPEAAEFDPELAELSKELNTWIEQSEQMSCAVATQTMAINQLENGYYRERDLIEFAESRGWYDDGTRIRDVGKIAEAMGLEVERLHGVSADELIMANDPEVKVMAAVDTTLLLYPECGKRCQPDHELQVLRVEDTENGRVVIVNDPGHPNGRGEVYPIEMFANAFRGEVATVTKGEKA